jgi:hypothetical protein
MVGGRAQSVRDELHQQGGGGEGGHGCPSPDLASFGGRETVEVAQGVN